MINELLSKFKGYYDQWGDKIILDNIALECGLYIKANNQKELEEAEYMLIEKNGKDTYAYILDSNLDKSSNGCNIDNIFNAVEENLYNYFKIRHYCSMTKDANAVLDGAKKIFSTNYYTFAMKPKNIKTVIGVCDNEKAVYFSEEENSIGTINNKMKKFEDIVNTYYNKLTNLQIIETNKADILNTILKNINDSEILRFDKDVDTDELNLNKDFILKNFKNILHKFNAKYTINNEPIDKYIHIFFDVEEDKYINEYKKYTIKSTFLNDDFNFVDGGVFFALSRFNNIMNGKIFLRNLSTAFNTNIKMNLEDLYYLNKFSEWIKKQKSVLFINIQEGFKPVDYENKGEEYFLIKHSGEIILDYEYVCTKDDKKFINDKNILQLIDKKPEDNKKSKNKKKSEEKEIIPPRSARKISYLEMRHEIDKTFFSFNLFKKDSHEKYLPIMNTYREVIDNIYLKSMTTNVYNILDTMTIKTIKARIAEGNTYKIAEMLNLRLAILEHYGKNMDKIYELLNREENNEEDNSEEYLLSQCGALLRVLNGAKNHKNIYDNKFDKDISILKGVVNKKEFNDIKKLINKLFMQRAHTINLHDKTIGNLLNKINSVDNFTIKDKIDYLLIGFLKVEKFI